MKDRDGLSPADERMMDFLREVGGGHEMMPHGLQARIEAHVRQEIQRRRTIGWRATAAVSLAAGFVLAVTGNAEVSLAYASLVGLSAGLYGMTVRTMIAKAT